MEWIWAWKTCSKRLRSRGRILDREMVGAEGFEPPTLCSQSRCATRLRYAPISYGLLLKGKLVGTGRFELPTPRTPSECSTRLSHVPTTRVFTTLMSLHEREPFCAMRFAGANQACPRKLVDELSTKLPCFSSAFPQPCGYWRAIQCCRWPSC